MMGRLSNTAGRAIEAYGGIDLWREAKRVEAEVSVKGLAFTLKGRPFFDHAEIIMDAQNPVSRLTPIGRDPEITGILDGDDVRLEKSNGEMLRARNNARSAFSSLRKNLRWDDLDMAYFANYAFWNYFTLPALLMRKDIQWEEVSSGVLNAEFPDSVPTHCRFQQFTFDENSGLLKRHNYTADVISRFARAANLVLSHSESDGALYASSRRVTPAGPNGKPMPFPELINIRVHRFSVQT